MYPDLHNNAHHKHTIHTASDLLCINDIWIRSEHCVWWDLTAEMIIAVFMWKEMKGGECRQKRSLWPKRTWSLLKRERPISVSWRWALPVWHQRIKMIISSRPLSTQANLAENHIARDFASNGIKISQSLSSIECFSARPLFQWRCFWKYFFPLISPVGI